MPQTKANGITIEYASEGDANAETILLIMGLGAQMTRWPPAFRQKLVEPVQHFSTRRKERIRCDVDDLRPA